MGFNEGNIKKIQSRDWASVRDKWLQFLPSIAKPGSPPSYEVCDFIGLQDVYNHVVLLKGAEYVTEVPNLRQAIFHEGLFLIHKAIHVSGTALMQLENGIFSWSLSNAYQSSFFALKGILALLGLSFPQFNKTLMVDCFREEELSKNKLAKGIQPKLEIRFLQFSDLSHVDYWAVLQRVVRVSEINVWDSQIMQYFSNIDPASIGMERNKLHYENHYWTFDDLFTPMTDDKFAVNEELLQTFIATVNRGKDYSFFLNYTLVLMALQLVKDLAVFNGDVAAEFQLMKTTLTAGIYSRLTSSVSELEM
jgi:uncharacterized protein (UPF0332 family)